MGDVINLFGFGKGGSKQNSSSFSGMKPNERLTKLSLAKLRRFSKTQIHDALPGGVLRAKVTTTARKGNVGPNGTIVKKGAKIIKYQKLNANDIKEAIEKKYVGKTALQIKRMIEKEKGIRIEESAQVIDINLERKKRENLATIVVGEEGLSPEEIARIEKNKEKNIAYTRYQDQEATAGMYEQLRNNRTEGNVLGNALVNKKNNTKISYKDLGIKNQGANAQVSALSGKTPAENKSETPNNVVPFRKNSEPNIPMQLTGTNN